MRKLRLAVLASHPIAYQAPLWKKIAEHPELEIKVLFEENLGTGVHFDPEFSTRISWEVPLLEGYAHEFLRGPVHLMQELWSGNFDALLVHGWNRPLRWFAVFAARMMGVKVLLRAESPFNQEKAKPTHMRALKRMLLGMFFFPVSAFLYIGEENRRFYLAHGVRSSKMFFTPYAVENERFMAGAEKLLDKKRELRRKIGVPEEAFVVLFVGKFIFKKRPMELLKAFAAADIPEKALVMVGDGELRELIEEFAGEKRMENVVIPGFKSQKELPEYYAAADVFVLPSGPGETWGLVVNEAMCFDLPVIVSEVVGCGPDLVREGENGYVVRLDDVAALVKGLEGVAGSGDSMTGVSRRIISAYSFEEDIRGILSALEA